MNYIPRAQHPLLDVTKININYLTKLDYIDLKNLCNTSIEFKHICEDNILLRSILANKNKNIIVTRDFDISSALNDIYGKIEILIFNNFSYTPDWINKEKFLNHMIRYISLLFVTQLTDEIIEYVDIPPNDTISINKSYLAFPFHSNEIELFDNDDEILN